MALLLVNVLFLWGAGGQQTLEFPKSSVGSIRTRATPSDPADLHDGWVFVCDAKGQVRIPPGMQVRLSVTPGGSQDLSWLGKLPPDSVFTLNLDDTEIDDDQLRTVATLTGLSHLTLRHTRITDRGIDHLQGHKTLRAIDFDGLGLAGEGFGLGDEAMAVFSTMPSLEAITMSRTPVTDEGLRRIRHMPHLRLLAVGSKGVTDKGLVHLKTLPKLETLTLGVYREGARVSEAGMKILGTLTKLKWLRIKGPNVTDTGLAHVANLVNLTYLDIDNTAVTGAGLRHLARMQSLKSIRLPDSLTDEGTRHLSRHANLERIVGNLEVSDEGVRHLTKLNKLTNLSLSDRVTSRCLDDVAKMKSLRTLWLQGVELGNEDIRKLSGLELEMLLLADSRVTEEGLAALNPKRLKHLVLRFHAVKTELSFLSKFKRLRSIDMSGSKLNPDDLTILSELPELRELTLEMPFTDESLRHLSDLRTLEALDISTSNPERQRLSDDAIAHLSRLTNLQFLSLYKGGHYTTRSIKHLVGMKKLRLLQVRSPELGEGDLRELQDLIPTLRVNIGRSKRTPPSIIIRDGIRRLAAPPQRTAIVALEGRRAPAIKATRWLNQDSPHAWEQLRGRVVLVWFWAEWSSRSRGQYSEVRRLATRYERLGLTVVAVHSTKGVDRAARFVKRKKVTWPVALDIDNASFKAWHVQHTPTLTLIDTQGRVACASVYIEDLERAIQKTLLKR